MTHRIAASLLWLGSASLLGQVVSWLSTMLVIRLLSPDDYGLMAMAMLSIGCPLLIGDLGVGAVVIQSATLPESRLRALFGVSLLTYLAAALVIYHGASGVAWFFGDDRLIPLVQALSLCFVFVGFYALPQSLLARDMQFDRKATVDVLTAVVSSAVSLTLALTGWGVWSLVAPVLVMHGFRAVGFQILRPCLFVPVPSIGELRGSVRFGGWVTVDRLLWFGYSNVDVMIGGRALGGALLGAYSVALSLVSIPLDKVMSVVTEVSFAAFSRAQDDRELFQRGVLRALELVSFVAFPTFLGMAAVAPEAVGIFLGGRWTEAVLPMQILCLIFPFRAAGLLFAPALLGTGRARLVVENNAIILGCVAIAIALGVQWGVVGLCVGWLLGYLPAFCIVAYRTMAALELPTREVIGAMTLSLVAALVMIGAVWLARRLVGVSWPPPAVLASLILVGMGSYGAVVVAVRPELLRLLPVPGMGRQ
jgi:O-antigen/teichoic acid export membrane protein